MSWGLTRALTGEVHPVRFLHWHILCLHNPGVLYARSNSYLPGEVWQTRLWHGITSQRSTDSLLPQHRCPALQICLQSVRGQRLEYLTTVPAANFFESWAINKTSTRGIAHWKWLQQNRGAYISISRMACAPHNQYMFSRCLLACTQGRLQRVGLSLQ